jgi:hypothetical protein
MAKQMSEATGTALAPDVATERWMALLEAAMSSPVRTTVRPKGLPAQPTADLRKAVMLATPRMPGLREALGSNAPPSSGPGRIPPPPSAPPAAAPEAPEAAVAEAPETTAAGGADLEPAPEETDDVTPASEPSGDDGNDAVLVEELR